MRFEFGLVLLWLMILEPVITAKGADKVYERNNSFCYSTCGIAKYADPITGLIKGSESMRQSPLSLG